MPMGRFGLQPLERFCLAWPSWCFDRLSIPAWWGDPRAKLLQGQGWHKNRVQVYRPLGHPLNAGEAVNALTPQLDTVYRQVAKNFADNQAVSLDFTGKRTKLTIAHLNGLDESPTLKLLSKRISDLLPVVDLTELLLEINAQQDLQMNLPMQARRARIWMT